MRQYVMGIDHGGTGMKAVLFDMNGQEIASAYRSTPMLTPAPGHTERDMERLWEMNCETVREALERSGVDPTAIAGVSFSGHGKGLYLWGNDGRPVRPGIVSTDSRAWLIAERWNRDGTAQKLYPMTCQSVMACQPVALLKWLEENEPECLPRIRYIFGIKDYVRYRMTGRALGELTDLSGSNLINLRTCGYDPEILRLTGLEWAADKLPDLIYPSDPGGTVTAECAARTGLLAGTPVAAGLFDIDACAVGMNVCDDSRIAVIAGTWAINEYISRTPVVNRRVKMNSLYAIRGFYLAEESSPTSASNYDWVLKTLMEEAAGGDLYAWANAQVDSVSPDGQEIVFLPYLYGGSDDPRTKAAFIGLEAWHNRAQILRAVCEGIVFSHRKQIERLQSSREVPAPAIRLAGGMVRARGWVQMFADILGLPVETIDVRELGALGAAMTAAVAAGAYHSIVDAARDMVRIEKIYSPDPALKPLYDRKYESYLKAEASVVALYAGTEETP